MMLRLAIVLAALMVTSPAFAQWYEGGTLQRGTIADWKNATADNQLATSADFIASASSVPDISAVKDQAALDQIRKHAEDLQKCINLNIQQGNAADGDTVANTVILCMVVKKKTDQ